MKQPKPITYGDFTSKNTGHPRDMHCGGATMPFNEKLLGYAVPGVTGTIPGLKGKVVTELEAIEIIRDLAPLYP